jgi:hypothetical protein
MFLADALSAEPLSEEAPYIHPADLKNGAKSLEVMGQFTMLTMLKS